MFESISHPSRFVILMLFIVLLSACGKAAQEAQPESVVPRIVELNLVNVSQAQAVYMNHELSIAFTTEHWPQTVEQKVEIQWFRRNDTGETAIESAANPLYKIQLADVGYEIFCKIRALAQDEIPAGDWVESTQSILIQNQPPSVREIQIINQTQVSDSEAHVGALLRIDSYVFEDLEGAAEGESLIEWLRNNEVVASGMQYQVQSADSGFQLSLRYTPIDVNQHQGAASLVENFITILNSPPLGSLPRITGASDNVAHVNDELIAEFDYFDADGDVKGASVFEWLRGDTVISQNKTYVVTRNDLTQNLRVRITPVALEGEAKVGAPIESASVAIVNTAPSVSNLKLSYTQLPLRAGSILKAEYHYFDREADADASEIIWLRDGLDTGIRASTYSVRFVDANHNISFQVRAKDQAQLIGNLQSLDTAQALLYELNFAAPTATAGIKTLNFSWPTIHGADFYHLREHVDVTATPRVVQTDLPANETSLTQSTSFELSVFRQDWKQLRYSVEACDALTCVSSAEVAVSDLMLASIGYFKASNAEGDDNAPIFPNCCSLGDGFGWSVALSADGSVLAVGTPEEDSAITGIVVGSPNNMETNNLAENSGAVYIFRKTDSGWRQEAFVKASNAAAGDRFGESIALSADGKALVVGAAFEDSSSQGVFRLAAPSDTSLDEQALDSGAAYIFDYEPINGWQQTAFIKASNTGAGDGFAESVDISADGLLIAVAATREDSDAVGVDSVNTGDALDANALVNTNFNSGAVYTYRKSLDSGLWRHRHYIKASNTGAGDEFGHAISLSGDGNTLAVGAMLEDSLLLGISTPPFWLTTELLRDSGAVYVFSFELEATWNQLALMKPSNNIHSGQNFGSSIDLSNDGKTLVIGASGDFLRIAGIYHPEADQDPRGTPIVGGMGDAPNGSIFVFKKESQWIQQAYFKASNFHNYSFFGWNVAVSANGQEIAVGAFNDAGSINGVMVGAPSFEESNSSNDYFTSGSVFLFGFDGLYWSAKSYIKAPNTGPEDFFGYSLALSADGKTLAVGAADDSRSSGIGGDLSDALRSDGTANSSFDSGAVFLY
ncbi:MAG: FG-GAP repeat protein [Gammaproteobacteria bacterium]|nr:FG-GAP repeat protein [Gammaproteobacteria bacterium]